MKITVKVTKNLQPSEKWEKFTELFDKSENNIGLGIYTVEGGLFFTYTCGWGTLGLKEEFIYLDGIRLTDTTKLKDNLNDMFSDFLERSRKTLLANPPLKDGDTTDLRSELIVDFALITPMIERKVLTRNKFQAANCQVEITITITEMA